MYRASYGGLVCRTSFKFTDCMLRVFRHFTRAISRDSSYILSLLSTALYDTTYNGPFYSVMITSRKTP